MAMDVYMELYWVQYDVFVQLACAMRVIKYTLWKIASGFIYGEVTYFDFSTTNSMAFNAPTNDNDVNKYTITDCFLFPLHQK